MMRYPGCPCYWLEQTDKMRVQLRRFTFGVYSDEDNAKLDHRKCPAGRSGHDAAVILPREYKVRFTHRFHGKTLALVPKNLVPSRDDPAWPSTCGACGEPFLDTDQWQTSQCVIYVRSDTGERVPMRNYPGKENAGALFDAWWMHPEKDGDYVPYNATPGPDGIILCAVCPNGLMWCVDGEATGGGRWSRSGDPRRPETLTVSPSIVAGDYHGFLQAGRFTDDLGS